MVDGRYHVVRRLGEGSQAVVLAALDRRLGVGRALKALRPHLAASSRTRTRFESEARTLALVEHEHVVRVYDVAASGRTVYLVLEHVGGGSLLDRIEREGPLPADVAVRLVSRVCSGLALAHAHGIVHRDIKPQNLLLARDGTVKLADFGIARTASGHQTVACTRMGTLGFVAPEQLADARSVDGRADVYGLGMTLFVLVTGTPPEAWRRERRHPRLHPALAAVIERATDEAAYARHPSVEDLAADLEACLRELPRNAGFSLASRHLRTVPQDPEWTPLDEIATWFGAPTAPLEAHRPPVLLDTSVPVPAPAQPPPSPEAPVETPPPVTRPVPGGRGRLLDHLARAAWLFTGSLVLLAAVLALAFWLGTSSGRAPAREGRPSIADQRAIAASLALSVTETERVGGLFAAWDRAEDDASRARIERLIHTELEREARRLLVDEPERRSELEARIRELDRASMLVTASDQ